jgi:hypothetical protein
MSDIPGDLSPEGKVAWLKIQGRTSCLECAYLYFQDTGYSNYTVEDTEVRCALNRNPHLPADKPYDWYMPPGTDNWARTQNSICEELVELGTSHRAHFDVDGEEGIEQFGLPPEVESAILKDR